MRPKSFRRIFCAYKNPTFYLTIHPFLKHKNYPNVFFASASEKKHRGVAVAIRDLVGFTLRGWISDPAGRYLILVGEINNRIYTLVNLYAPNAHQLRFFHRLLRKIDKVKKGAVIICGDYNMTVDYNVDTTSKSKRPPPMML